MYTSKAVLNRTTTSSTNYGCTCTCVLRLRPTPSAEIIVQQFPSGPRSPLVASRDSSQFMLRTLLLVSPPLQYAPWWPPPTASDIVEIGTSTFRNGLPTFTIVSLVSQTGCGVGAHQPSCAAAAGAARWLERARPDSIQTPKLLPNSASKLVSRHRNRRLGRCSFHSAS